MLKSNLLAVIFIPDSSIKRVSSILTDVGSVGISKLVCIFVLCAAEGTEAVVEVSDALVQLCVISVETEDVSLLHEQSNKTLTITAEKEIKCFIQFFLSEKIYFPKQLLLRYSKILSTVRLVSLSIRFNKQSELASTFAVPNLYGMFFLLYTAFLRFTQD